MESIADGPSIYPEYLTDPNIGGCPSDSNSELETWHVNDDESLPWDPCKFRATSYNYFAWAAGDLQRFATKDVNGLTFDPFNDFTADFLLAQVMLNEGITDGDDSDNSAHEDDIIVGSETVYRLREGIERFFITDINNPAASAKAQSDIWIMWDDINAGEFIAFTNHLPGGSNVLYMDGHVEFQRYPSEGPVVVAWVKLFQAVT